MREFDIRLEELAPAVAATFVFLLGVELAGEEVPLLRPVVGLFLFGFFPGAVLLATLGIEPRDGRKRILYAVGVSLVVAMGVGLILNLVLPAFGIDRPLSTGPLLVPYLFGIAGLCGWRLFVGESLSYRVRVPTRLEEFRTWQLVALLLPLLSVVAVSALNVERRQLPMVGFLIFLAIVPVVVATRDIETRDLSVLVWGLALAVLWHKSLWVEFTYGGHASVVGIFQSGYWLVGGETLLVNAVLMPALAQLLGVEILTHMKVVMPVFVSLIPLALFATFGRYVTPRVAFLATNLFVFSHPFYFQYPSTPRASFPVFFLALIGVTIADQSSARVHTRALSLLFAAGVVVSHYGTSYYVLFATVGSVGLLYLLRVVDVAIDRDTRVREFVSTFRRQYVSSVLRSLRRSDTHVFGWSYGVFYSIAVLSWYLFVDQGSKFVLFTEQLVNAYLSLFVEQGGQGSTATRLATDYGSRSIAFSKLLYLIIAALVGTGIVVCSARRLLYSENLRFDDEYLSISVLLFVLFGATLVVSGAWGGGRPLMIVLSFGAIFAAVALLWSADLIVQVGNTVSERINPGYDSINRRSVRSGALISFSVLLATFFVINTGVMSAVAFGGEAPSNVPAADPEERYQDTDIRTQVWLTDHRDQQYLIHTDQIAHQQVTDWRNGEITARSERQPYRFKQKHNLQAIDDPQLETGYIVLLAHNVHDDRVQIDHVTSRPIESYELSLRRRNRIYTSGSGAVYFHPERSVGVNSGDNRTADDEDQV